MKRVGRVRECDSKYLSGRPSFTLSSWGMQDGLAHEELTTIVDNRAVGTHNHAKLTSIKGRRAPQLGGMKEYNESKIIKQSRGIYQSQSAPLLAHVWPTISQTAFSKVVPNIGHTKSAPSVGDGWNLDKRKSYDPYGAGGTKFRASMGGNQINTHTGGINLEGMPANLQRQVKKDETEHFASIKSKERKKDLWNQSPHYHDKNGPAPKLNANPYATVTYSEFHNTKKKKATKKTVFSYTQPPFPIICPEPVLWELSRKKDAKLAKTRWAQQTARQDAKMRQTSPAKALAGVDAIAEEEEEEEEPLSPPQSTIGGGDLPAVRGSVAHSFPE